MPPSAKFNAFRHHGMVFSAKRISPAAQRSARAGRSSRKMTLKAYINGESPSPACGKSPMRRKNIPQGLKPTFDLLHLRHD
jgi:hypothetical protein